MKLLRDLGLSKETAVIEVMMNMGQWVFEHTLEPYPVESAIVLFAANVAIAVLAVYRLHMAATEWRRKP